MAWYSLVWAGKSKEKMFTKRRISMGEGVASYLTNQLGLQSLSLGKRGAFRSLKESMDQ